jgi:hypothetical protein
VFLAAAKTLQKDEKKKTRQKFDKCYSTHMHSHFHSHTLLRAWLLLVFGLIVILKVTSESIKVCGIPGVKMLRS